MIMWTVISVKPVGLACKLCNEALSTEPVRPARPQFVQIDAFSARAMRDMCSGVNTLTSLLAYCEAAFIRKQRA